MLRIYYRRTLSIPKNMVEYILVAESRSYTQLTVLVYPFINSDYLIFGTLKYSISNFKIRLE